MLYELELVLDRPLVADKAETPFVWELRIGSRGVVGLTVTVERLPEGKAPAENPSSPALLITWRLLVAGVGLANVGGTWDLRTLRIRRISERVDVALFQVGVWVRPARILWSILSALQWRTRLVAADELGAKKIFGLLLLFRLDGYEVPEALDVLP